MSHYIYSSDGITAQGGLRANLPEPLKDADKATRIAAGWYDYVSTAPEPTEGETVLCVGFVRLGEDFTGVYRVIPAPPEPTQTRIYSAEILSAIGEVVGGERYDAVKAALAEYRLDGTPVWDILVSGMFVAQDDPHLADIRAIAVGSGLVTEVEFDDIIAKAIEGSHHGYDEIPTEEASE